MDTDPLTPFQDYIDNGTPLEREAILELASSRGREIFYQLGGKGIELTDPDAEARYQRLCQLVTRHTHTRDYRGRPPFDIEPGSGVFRLKHNDRRHKKGG